jgi:hypothetical protein
MALALMQIGCWPLREVGRRRVDYCVDLWRRNPRGKKKIMFGVCDFTLCSAFPEQVLHKSSNTCIIVFPRTRTVSLGVGILHE